MGRTQAEIAAELESFIRSRHPDADTSEGSVLRDIIIHAPSVVLSYLNSRVDVASRGQSPETAVTDREVEGLARGMGLFRRSGFKAKGTITFVCTSATGPAIPAGSVVSTRPPAGEKARRFVTTESSLSGAWDYSSTVNAYVKTLTIEAEEVGVGGVVPAGAVTEVVSALSGVSYCYNAAATSGGVDRESLSLLLNRVRQRIRGTGAGTLGRYYAFALSQSGVEDALAIGSDNEYLTRATAGAVDIFVIGTSLQGVADEFTLTSLVDIVPNSQPIHSVQFVKGDITGTLTEGVHWQFTKDTEGARSGSYLAQDKIEFLTSLPDTVIQVDYVCNGLIGTLQDLFKLPSNRVEGADVLVRLATEVTVDITCRLRVATGYDQATALSALATSLGTLFSDYRIGQRVEQSEIIAAINNVSSVSSVLYPLTVFQSSDGTLTEDILGGLAIPDTSYARLGTLSVTFV